MTVTKDDFEKIWASSSPLTPYSFSDSQYKEGWNFVGATPPSRQMWDAFMQGADEKLKYLYQHEDIPLGHEYFTFNPNVPQGSLPLFGGEYDRATYSDLWNWVQEQTGYLKTEAEWQTLSTANNGNVPYYSDGDGSTTFRVPSLKCWVKGANGTVSEVGSYLAAGLPNITGKINNSADTAMCLVSASANIGTGALNTSAGSKNLNVFNSATGTYSGEINFDASRSNSIYGNSTTVQPPSIVGMWLVKAYGVIVDTGTIDEQQYIDDRMNAMTQYVNDSVGGINTRLGTVLTASGSSTEVGAVTEVCSIPLHEAGVWLIVAFMKLDYNGTGVYNCTILTTSHGDVNTRNSEVAGGGNNAVMLTALGKNEVVTLRGYKPTAGTMSGNLRMVRLA